MDLGQPPLHLLLACLADSALQALLQRVSAHPQVLVHLEASRLLPVVLLDSVDLELVMQNLLYRLREICDIAIFFPYF